MNFKKDIEKADKDQAVCDEAFEKWWNTSVVLRKNLMPDQNKEYAKAIFSFGWMGHQYPGAYENNDVEMLVASFFGLKD